MKNWIKLLISIALPLLVGFSGSQFTDTGQGTWYASIDKPDWNPPGWVFGPVWTSLYILMGIAFYLIWKSDTPRRQKNAAMILWVVQLVLNFLWSFIFFEQHELGLAVIEIILLWLAILATIFAFARISRLAAWLLVPYISWVSFASILTWTIWELNR